MCPISVILLMLLELFVSGTALHKENGLIYKISNGSVSPLTNMFLESIKRPDSYDRAQLWRIHNITSSRKKYIAMTHVLEEKFGAVIWKESEHYVDISISKEHLNEARCFITEHNVANEVLCNNIQDLIDNERSLDAQDNKRAARATGQKMHWEDYHDLEIIYGFMREIRSKFPNIVRLYTIGKTFEGRDLKVLRISENPRDYKKIWVDGGIHAREWISPATVTFLLYQLMANWEVQPSYIRHRTWYVMPIMNPDGYDYSRKKNRLWRKNRSISANSNCFGVDLNRNFDIGWYGYGSSTNPCSDTYRGRKPASELETESVVSFLSKRKYNLEAYLTYHSYGQMIVYPWAYKAVKVKDASALQRVANAAVKLINNETGSTYRASVTHEVLGIAGGGSDDWTRAVLGTKYVYTVELRDRGRFGFVLPTNQILQTGQEGLIILKTVAQAIG